MARAVSMAITQPTECSTVAHHNALPCIGRVGQDLLIAIHGRVKDQLADAVSTGTDGLTVEHSPVGQNQRCFQSNRHLFSILSILPRIQKMTSKCIYFFSFFEIVTFSKLQAYQPPLRGKMMNAIPSALLPQKSPEGVSCLFIVLIRTIVLYFIIIVGIRLQGKRQLGELEPTELVLALVISDLAAVPMQDNGVPLFFGIIPIITLLAISTLLSVLTVRSIRFRNLLCGKPSIVVRDGVVQESEMRKNRLTVDELMEELRSHGYADFSSVKYAVLETNGQLSVLPYAEERPITARQMKIDSPETGLPIILISDGRVLEHNLKGAGYEKNWLLTQLSANGLSRPDQAFLLTVDECGGVYCVPKGKKK